MVAAASPRLGEVYLTSHELQARVRELGRQIARDYEGREPMLVAPLKASLVFLADQTLPAVELSLNAHLDALIAPLVTQINPALSALLVERAGKRVASAGNIGPTMLDTLSA